MAVHKDLTGADLHEPKGADTATSGKVYVSDGAGSGVWTTASSIITNTAFSTGDLKPTHKSTADTSWIMWSDGTIGDGSSSATIRANADTEDLFALYWDGYSNTLCPIYNSAGVASTRGGSAAADFAAHKRLAVPAAAGRALGLAGAGSGLTSRTLGSTVGAETVTLTRANLPNTSVTVTITDPGHFHSISNLTAGGIYSNNGNNAGTPYYAGSSTNTASKTTGITAAFNLNGSVTQTTVATVTPTAFINVMIKL